MYTYKASIISVINGNTIDADIDLGFNVVIRQRVKLFGVDILEDKESEAKTKLSNLLSRNVIIETMLNKRGKFGRVMGNVKVKHNDQLVDINQLMVDSGLAIKYETR